MTQFDIFNAIPVARILVHTFEKLKAMDNGGGRRPVLLNTSREGFRIGYTWKSFWGNHWQLKEAHHEHHNGSWWSRRLVMLGRYERYWN